MLILIEHLYAYYFKTTIYGVNLSYVVTTQKYATDMKMCVHCTFCAYPVFTRTYNLSKTNCAVPYANSNNVQLYNRVVLCEL